MGIISKDFGENNADESFLLFLSFQRILVVDRFNFDVDRKHRHFK